MRAFSVFLVLLLGGLLFVLSFAVRRAKLFLVRDNGAFRIELQFLFYRRPLYDSRFPVEAMQVTRKKLVKKLAELKQENAKEPPQNPFRTVFFYSKMTVLLFLLLREERVPRVHIRIRHCSIRIGSDDPSRTAVLCGATYAGLSYLLAFFDRISRLTCDNEAFSVSSLGERYFDASFEIELSLPLLYYFQVFHCIVPDSERVLTALKKRRKKLQLRQKNGFRRSSHVGKQSL